MTTIELIRWVSTFLGCYPVSFAVSSIILNVTGTPKDRVKAAQQIVYYFIEKENCTNIENWGVFFFLSYHLI